MLQTGAAKLRNLLYRVKNLYLLHMVSGLKCCLRLASRRWRLSPLSSTYALQQQDTIEHCLHRCAHKVDDVLHPDAHIRSVAAPAFMSQNWQLHWRQGGSAGGEVEMSPSTMVKLEAVYNLSLAVVEDQHRSSSKTASGLRPPHHSAAAAAVEPMRMTRCSSFLLLLTYCWGLDHCHVDDPFIMHHCPTFVPTLGNAE